MQVQAAECGEPGTEEIEAWKSYSKKASRNHETGLLVGASSVRYDGDTADRLSGGMAIFFAWAGQQRSRAVGISSRSPPPHAELGCL